MLIILPQFRGRKAGNSGQKKSHCHRKDNECSKSLEKCHFIYEKNQYSRVEMRRTCDYFNQTAALPFIYLFFEASFTVRVRV
jgi:hypothetical protein